LTAAGGVRKVGNLGSGVHFQRDVQGYKEG
jgi:hypothetical protein